MNARIPRQSASSAAQIQFWAVVDIVNTSESFCVALCEEIGVRAGYPYRLTHDRLLESLFVPEQDKHGVYILFFGQYTFHKLIVQFVCNRLSFNSHVALLSFNLRSVWTN